MAVSTDTMAVRCLGNDSTETEYTIDFPFLDPSHILAAVSVDGVAEPVNLSPSQYTVTRLPDGSRGFLYTAAAVTPPAEIVIYRQVPLMQPTVFQAAGPFPAKANETALDRLLMQVQQVNRRVNELEGATANDFVRPPSGNPDEIRDVLTWASAPARGAVKPQWTGQLGVQRDTQDLYIAQSTNVGDWSPFDRFEARPWKEQWRAFKYNESVVSVEGLYLGTTTEPTLVKNLSLAVATAGTAITFQVYAGAVLLGDSSLAASALITTLPCRVPNTTVPAGTQIAISIVSTGYGGSRPLGLDVTLHCQRP